MKLDLAGILWDQIPDALLAIDPQGIVAHWNPAAEAVFGYRAQEAQGQSIFSLIVPADRQDEERQAQADALRKGLAVFESVRRRKDGTLVHVNVSTRAIRGPDGRLECFLSTKKDVTHLKVLRDAKLVEARFQDLLESTPDAIVMVNVTGRIVMVNGQAESLFGYPRATLIGQPVEYLLPTRFHHAHLRHRAHFFEQPRTRTMGAGLELYGLRSNGDEFPVEISLSPLQTEEGTMVMSAIRDITDRKKADKKFRDLLESAPDAMVIVNRDGVMVLVNHQAVRLFGWSQEEMLGRSIDILVPTRFRPQHASHRSGFAAQSRARAMGAGLDLYGLRKDGSEFPVEISLSPMETEEGPFVSSAIRDVTERKRFEQALRDKNMQLEDAARIKDRFLATMSHELRTPLNAVIGFTGTLLMELPGTLNAEQKRQLGLVQSSADHLLSLINDLLDLAKLDDNSKELQWEPVDCRRLLEELSATYLPQALQKGLAFDLHLPDGPLQLFTDHRALRQILINLVGNAIKFTRGGRVGLLLEPGSATSPWVFQVQDTGAGIAAQDQQRLFQAFSRLEAAERDAIEGTGLGLHLSRRLAQALGGTLELQSALGRGSTFTLALPDRPGVSPPHGIGADTTRPPRA
ncbi:MAG: PAS domain S-box protein [Rhodoferax sp.]|nr:PAS domain S-box protein [Rhodoferax sp.]